jgi:hypothetical protein
MDLKALIESLATGWGERLIIIVPLALVGALSLYVAWLVIGYLHAAQAGIEADAVVGEAVAVDPSAAVTMAAGAPFCPVDGLVHPAGAAYCARCEADLARHCATCDTTIGAMDAVCFSCGARQ